MKSEVTKWSLPRNVKVPNILFANERMHFLMAIDNFEDLIFARLGMFSGLRLNEIMNIKVKDINFEEKSIYVIGKGDKARFIPTDHSTLQILKCHTTLRKYALDDKLFNITNRTMQNRIETYGEKANITRIKCTPHLLRHTCCSLLLHRGVPVEIVMRIMGHSKLATTMIYYHTTPHLIVNSYYNVMGGP